MGKKQKLEIRVNIILNSITKKIRLIHAKKKAAKLGYVLPTFLVSFPRSGSNFLQSVLQGSSGFLCQSIYGPYPDDTEPVLSLKSHAISLEHLLDEINRLLPDVSQPSKIILLPRDPRDVMISFFEFTQVRRNIILRQENFLDISYFYASTIDKTSERKIEYTPLNITEAYKSHIKNWFVNKPEHLDCLTLRYEDLVQSPNKHFQHLFEFLNLNCSIATEMLEVKVSLYSQTSAQRGQAQGWRAYQDKYAGLLAQVQTLFGHEMRVLGYDE